VAHKHREADLVETPEVRTSRDLCEDPAEEKGIQRDQQKGVCEIAVVLKIKVTVEKAENKIGIGKGSHRKTGNGPPAPDSVVLYRFRNNRASKGMGEAVHEFMITLKPQIFTTSVISDQ